MTIQIIAVLAMVSIAICPIITDYRKERDKQRCKQARQRRPARKPERVQQPNAISIIPALEAKQEAINAEIEARRNRLHYAGSRMDDVQFTRELKQIANLELQSDKITNQIKKELNR